jgi:tetratricopeptide (TPR) repeat protein
VVEGLISVVDKSLLRQEEGVGGEPRFVMLEMIQEYARDKLQDSGEDRAIKRLHALYFATLAEEANPRRWGPAEAQQLDRLEQEHDNLRAAIRWGRSQGGDIEIALRLVVSLGRFWEYHGHLSEGRATIAAVLAEPESQVEELRSLRAWAILQIEILAYWQGDFVASRSAAEEALTLYRALGETEGIARALTSLWDSATAQGEHEKSFALATEALRIARELGDKEGIRETSVMLGWSLMYLGNLTQAAAQLEEAVIAARELGVPNRIAFALGALGEVKVRQGRYDQAIPLLEEALAMRRSMGHRSYVATVLGTMTIGAIRQEEYGRATELLTESLTIRKELGDKGGVAWCLEKFAQMESSQGDALRAAHLLGAAEALREILGTAVDTVDRAEHAEAVRVARERLGEEEFSTAWRRGRDMSMDEAANYTLTASREFHDM